MFLLAISLLQAPAKTRLVDACPELIQIVSTGEVYTNRFHGRYATSLKLLASDLRSGCYNDSNPSPVTSVTVQIAPNAPHIQVEAVYKTLEQNGWPKGKLKIERWSDAAGH